MLCPGSLSNTKNIIDTTAVHLRLICIAKHMMRLARPSRKLSENSRVKQLSHSVCNIGRSFEIKSSATIVPDRKLVKSDIVAVLLFHIEYESGFVKYTSRL